MSTQARIIPVGGELPLMLTPEELADRESRLLMRQTRDNRAKRGHKRRSVVRKRFALLNAFVDQALPLLGSAPIRMWLLLYRHGRGDGTACLSIADLARRGGCSSRMARYALVTLVSAGLLRRIKRGTLSGGPSVYRLESPSSGS